MWQQLNLSQALGTTQTSLREALEKGKYRGKESGLGAHLSCIPLKLLPMMTMLDSAAGAQFLQSRLLYSAFPQCTM